jgi:hypothetical protein
MGMSQKTRFTQSALAVAVALELQGWVGPIPVKGLSQTMQAMPVVTRH